MTTRRVIDERNARAKATCPRCGRQMDRIDHEIAGPVRARPCGCLVRYSIDDGVVTVTKDAA